MWPVDPAFAQLPLHEVGRDPDLAALLDATVRIGGQVEGIISLEYFRHPRQWAQDEQNFAGSLADMVALAFTAAKRREAEAEMIVAKENAELANRAKSEFLANMSHELRTPLNAILGFSEIMKDEVLGPMDNANYKGYAADIHGSGQHLLHLINEILDLSRIEAGRHELQEEALHLTDIVEECCTMMQIRAKAKDISLLERHDTNLPQVWADERALRQVILNLLSNAVKFTPTSGEIRIWVGRSADGGQFVSIADTGPGIPEEEIPIVLEAFGQGAVAIKSAEPGTGLGLSIVQALVKMHGGKFELKSKLRQGTEVIVSLPKSRVMNFAADAPAAAAGQDERPDRRKRA